MSGGTSLLLFLLIGSILFYHRSSIKVWLLASIVWLGVLTYFSKSAKWLICCWWLALLMVLLPLAIKSIRRRYISQLLLQKFRKVMPAISKTEQEAIHAGSVGWEAEFFSGRPNWQKLFAHRRPELTSEEQAFLDGPVEQLCHMVNDWEITHELGDLPEAIWQFLKEQGFFAMIIPKEYGGKQFSALAHSRVLVKLATVSTTVASTVSVPNSLGPGELILHYGTTEQKNYYLPRLAKGEEIPCFALTGPEAGSDASAMPDYGIVCEAQYQGKKVLGIKLNFEKRYITLAPIATLIALAFRLFDPDHLLGEQEELGITCALVPRNLQGITIGHRHIPLNIPFQNGPILGKNVFIPLDWVIGGAKMVGSGWRMLVECLAVGRAISLPSNSVGSAKVAALACGAYARIRRQFGTAIGLFEGIQEPLKRITCYTYAMEALSLFAPACIDQNEKSAIASAIVKYHVTELGRQVINDAMDIHGGKAICLGPKNYLGRIYQGIPIGITVEGANILTRNLIIFGQGVIRCHPYILSEMLAMEIKDPKQALHQFDNVLFEHIGFTISNMVRTLFLSITFSRLASAPVNIHPATKRYFQKLTRYSAVFAFITDVSLMILGGTLKRKEYLSARLGDVLSMLYIISITLKHFHDQGAQESDLPIIDWLCQDLIYKIHQRIYTIVTNFPNRWVGRMLRFIIFIFGRYETEPEDELGRRIAALLTKPSDTRDRLLTGCYIAADQKNSLAMLEQALVKTVATEALEKRVLKAVRDKAINGITYTEQVCAASDAQLINDLEMAQLLDAYEARMAVIRVDDFDAKTVARYNAAPEKINAAIKA